MCGSSVNRQWLADGLYLNGQTMPYVLAALYPLIYINGWLKNHEYPDYNKATLLPFYVNGCAAGSPLGGVYNTSDNPNELRNCVFGHSIPVWVYAIHLSWREKGRLHLDRI